MTIPDDVRSSAPLDPPITELIGRDHQEVRALFARLAAEEDSYERRRLFEELARTLAVHEAAEEEVVYPVLARTGSDGAALRRERLAEERRGKHMVARMMRQAFRDPAGLRFRHNIGRLSEVVEAHASHEEETVLPLLARTQDDTKLRVMASLFTTAKSTAPTRAHPLGPDRLPGLLATGPVFAVLDRMRDLGRRIFER